MTRLSTFLMFVGERNGKAEEAMNFYVSKFKNSRIEEVKRWGPGAPGGEGTIMHATFTLNGQSFMASDNSGPHDFNFTPSTSVFVECEDEAQIEHLFLAFLEGGHALMPLGNYGFSKQFGWLIDRFGVSWQFNLP